VPVGVFRRAEQREIGSELDRALQITGSEGVIDERGTPALRVISATAAMSMTLSRGLVGDSIQTKAGFSLVIWAKFFFLVKSKYWIDTPNFAKTWAKRRKVQPYDVFFREHEIAGFQGGNDRGDGGDAAGEAGAKRGAFPVRRAWRPDCGSSGSRSVCSRSHLSCHTRT